MIGAYQEGDPGRRTIFVSTHLIAEFEGLIDDFTIMDRGRAVLTLEADDARARYQRIRARFAEGVPEVEFSGARRVHWRGRELELITDGDTGRLVEQVRRLAPESCSSESLTLEEVFVATLT